MKRYFSHKFILFILLAVACNQEAKVTQKIESNTDYYSPEFRDQLDDLLAISDSMFNIRTSEKKCEQTQRQILRVTSFVMNHFNYKDSGQPKAKDGRGITLYGAPTGSSCPDLSLAYIHFVEDGSPLKNPSYNVRTLGNGKTRGEIRLYMYDNYYESLVLTLRESKEIYCWYGNVNGQLYGEVAIAKN